MESAPGETKNARRLDVSACDHERGQTVSFDCVCKRILRQPVSLRFVTGRVFNFNYIDLFKRSTDDVFNPKQDNSHKTYHSLVDLLNTLSASFKKNFSAIQKKR